MRRVVVTGLGIVSSIGNNADEVTASLRDAKSGISVSNDFAEHGFKCQVWGKPTLDRPSWSTVAPMRFLRRAAWNHVAMKQAIADAGWKRATSPNPRTGIIMGSGGPSTRTIVEARRSRSRTIQPQAHRTVRSAEGDVVDRLGDARHLVQDPRRQLFDLVGLLDLGALHRQRLPS
jgi:3-oxoacyl-[acyl-carrier-protein] synthase-1